MKFVIIRYRIEATTLGFHIRLRTRWEPDPANRLPPSPSHLISPVGWALTEAGAHRKARRIIARSDRRAARAATAKEYPA